MNNRSTIQKQPQIGQILWQSFTGKERDEETGYGYFGARYMDHELMTMWLSVDPMADKYPSLSPYNYCAWNSIRLMDSDGMEIDLSHLNNTIKDRIIKCLSSLTGLSLYYNNENGLLEYAKDDNGNIIRATGSASERADMIDAIDKKNKDESNYRIEVGIGKKSAGGQNDKQTAGYIRLNCDMMSENDDCKTNGLGMVFLHELRHAVTGESDPEEGFVNLYIGSTVNANYLLTGPVVNRVNVYRQELGMLIRIQYYAREDGKVPFCPVEMLN